MIELTESQRQALEKANGNVVKVINPETKEEYVLIRAEAFSRLAAAIDYDFSVKDAYPLLEELGRQAGWDDPEWDSYDIYARKKPT